MRPSSITLPAWAPRELEAKALVGAAPSTILEGAKKDVAEDAKAKLEAAGGKVTLK